MTVRKQAFDDNILAKLAKLKSFTLSDFKELGMAHSTLYNLISQGKITRLSRGIYSVTGLEPIGSEGDYIIANRKLEGECIIGGLTALAHYKLLDEVPRKIWLLVPPEVRTTDKRYRLLRTYRDLSIGIIKKKEYKIVSLERALIDALVYISKIGERVAKKAIVKAIRTKQTSEKKLFEMAKLQGETRVLNKHWQSILSGL